MADEQYIVLPVESDPEALAEEGFAYLESVIDGWESSAGNVENWLIQACARIAAETRSVAADVPKAIFRYFGSTVMGIPPIDDVAASATLTVTMVDNAGYTLPEGTVYSLRGADGLPVAFEQTAEVVVAPGDTSTAAGEVQVVAVDAGTEANDATSPAELVDALEYVSTVSVVDLPSGGTDAETDDEYLVRLSTELQLMTPRPILPNDFAVLARRITGVERATAVDGWNDDLDTSGNDRTISVAVMDADGAALGAGVKADVLSYLESLREVNFNIFVIDPTVNTIDVEFEATAQPGYDAAEVEARAIDTITEWLQPYNWGLPPSGVGETREWRNTTSVRYLDVASVLKNVDGLDALTLLEVDAGTSDVALTGPAPVTTPGTITGTVT